jgi:hypothetical protein
MSKYPKAGTQPLLQFLCQYSKVKAKIENGLELSLTLVSRHVAHQNMQVSN